MSTSSNTPAQKLRIALKGAGFNARKVTVRHPHCTMHVTIRDASVSLTEVTAIAGTFESVSRDHATGEILCGGNTFVDVKYDDALIEPIAAQILAVLRAAADDVCVDLPGGFRAAKVSRKHGGATYWNEVRIWGPTFDHGTVAAGIEHAAGRIAVAHIDASALASRNAIAEAPSSPGVDPAGAPPSAASS